MYDQKTDTPLPESIRLYSICSAMDFNHLPVAGGIYDQHPKLVEQWQMLFEARAEKRKLDEAKRNHSK